MFVSKYLFQWFIEANIYMWIFVINEQILPNSLFAETLLKICHFLCWVTAIYLTRFGDSYTIDES